MANLLPRKVTRAVRNPRWAWGIARTYLLPQRIIAANAEAYFVVGSYTFGKAPRRTLSEIFPGITGVSITIENAFARTTGTSLEPGELVAVCAIVKQTRAGSILEIGTFEGNTTLNLAANSGSAARIVTLDLEPNNENETARGIPTDMQNRTASARVGAQFRDSVYAARIKQVYGDSMTIDWAALGPPFDLIFIDGCHYLECVKSDTRQALAHLTPDGIVIWHDYGISEDVSRAVDSFSEEIQISALKGTRLAVGRAKGKA